MPDFGFRIDFVIKDWFFNTENVKRYVSDVDRAALAKFGAYVRTTALRSMKFKGPSKAGKPGYYSAPGQPPHAHSNQGLKRGRFNIVYGYDPSRRSVVIGPRKMPGRNDYRPLALEKGDSRANVPNPRRKVRKIGDVGAIRYTTPKAGTSSKGYIRKVKAVNGHYYDVMFTHLNTAAQLRRSDTVETFIWGPKTFPSVKMEARPYMAPAFWKGLWRKKMFWASAKAERKVYYTGIK